jgi:ankyrin repeat protein
MLLIDAGADVNRVDAAGNTPLHIAALNKSTHVIEVLLAANARVDARNALGATALMMSADPAIQDRLIRAGASVNDIRSRIR